MPLAFALTVASQPTIRGTSDFTTAGTPAVGSEAVALNLPTLIADMTSRASLVDRHAIRSRALDAAADATLAVDELIDELATGLVERAV